MIGSVTLAEDGKEAVAVLHPDAAWTFAGDPDVQKTLGLATRVVGYEYGGPWDGPYGARWVNEVARLVGGTAYLTPSEPKDEVVLY